MKKLYLLTCILGVILFPACEGPQGPPGIDGMDGEDGEDGGLFLSTVLETSANFTEEDGFQAVYGLEIPESANLMIYVALGLDDEENVVWMPLPQTFPLEQGVIFYNYFFTKDYFSIFLDSNVSPDELPAEYTENVVFRIVVIPGQYLEQSARIDLNNYHTVMKWMGKSESDIEHISSR